MSTPPPATPPTAPRGQSGAPLLELGLPGHADLRVRPGDVVEIDEEQAIALALPVPGSRLLVEGRDLSAKTVPDRVRAGLVVLGHVEVSPDDGLADHLRTVVGGPKVDPEVLLADAPLLAGRPEAKAGWLSGGERQVLGWLRTLAHAPRVVVLDGAGRGLDQPTLRWARDQIGTWRADGVAVLVRVGREEEQDWLGDQAIKASD